MKKNFVKHFEQNHYSLTAKCFYRMGHDTTTLMEWMSFYDKEYEKITRFDLMVSTLSCLNEIS